MAQNSARRSIGRSRKKGGLRAAVGARGIDLLIRIVEGNGIPIFGKPGKLVKVGLAARMEITKLLIDEGLGRATERGLGTALT